MFALFDCGKQIVDLLFLKAFQPRETLLGEGVQILDGGAGTARQTKRLLEERGWLHSGEGSVNMENSAGKQELLDLGRELLYQ